MTTKKVAKTSDIQVKVHMNEEKIPVKMEWSASDAPFEGMQECKGMVLSMWDGKENTALRIDLWTEEMRVDEMNRFFFQTFMSLADTYMRATKNNKGANDIRKFAQEFGEKADVLKK